VVISHYKQSLLSIALLVMWALYGKPTPLVTQMRPVVYRPANLALCITMVHCGAQMSFGTLRFVSQTYYIAGLPPQSSCFHRSHSRTSLRVVGRTRDIIRVLATLLKMSPLRASRAIPFAWMTSMTLGADKTPLVVNAILVTVIDMVGIITCRQLLVSRS
jgi:hypothetical protein